MVLQDILDTVADVLSARDDVAFAYVHGSVLHSDSPADVDVAAFLVPDVFSALSEAGTVDMDFAIPLEFALEARLDRKVDVQVLNGAPLPFRARVATTGSVVVDRDRSARCEFECLSRCEYFDFRPRRREYLTVVVGR